MQLGETIATYDVGLALRGENGKFEVTSPAGEIFNVTCRPQLSISSMESSGNTINPQPFLIRKVAEPVSLHAERKVAFTAAEEPAPTARTPFLIENREENAKSNGGMITVLPDTDIPQKSEKVNLDLLYLEIDPITNQPSASVCLRGGQEQAILPERLTFGCRNFIELDVEIRRLHAQLDEIRYQARKKFYKAHAAAASA